MTRPAPAPIPCGEARSELLPEQAREDLRRIYEALDRCLAGLEVECRACGRCCDFARNPYVLYASFIERAAAREVAPEAALTPEGRCSFLSPAGLCLLRAWRPLGCRVFFCSPGHKAREQEIYEEFLARLRAASRRHGLPWDYRPFFQNSAPGAPEGMRP